MALEEEDEGDSEPSIALREEIDFVVGNSRLIQETDLPNLPYLQAVIKEALRLHPPTPLIVREFQQGCKIGGFLIPEKTKLILNVYSLMRDPNVWEDPLEFIPEKFLTCSSSLGKDEERKEQALKYLPFGGGRRACPASKLGYTVGGTTIGMMVQCFDWRIKGEKVNMDEWYKGFNQTMAHPLTLTPVTLDLDT
uniref:Cytochrome P450 705A22 n=1 Tax=Isatis tinctoria TaxID=161756 RepID=A0A8F0FSD3_ISATI|nr:cytochrome P450 705A22 [Isatis tinctoria]